jgi:hypothetical protein
MGTIKLRCVTNHSLLKRWNCPSLAGETPGTSVLTDTAKTWDDGGWPRLPRTLITGLPAQGALNRSGTSANYDRNPFIWRSVVSVPESRCYR